MASTNNDRLAVLIDADKAQAPRMNVFAIKTEISNPRARVFAFSEQKTMYGGKHVARGDMIFVFASENEGGQGLIASGIVTSAEANPKQPRHRPANAARQHYHQAHRAREAPSRTERA